VITPRLKLKKNHDRRLRAGHLWVYSNEVDTDATPLQGFAPGDVVEVENGQGRWQGLAYVNPNSLICARLLTRQRDREFDLGFLKHRFKVALALRERFFDRPYYRLAFGESDALPGLVVDRYGDYLVVQITTAGMERVKDLVLAALLDVVKPAAVLWRNDAPSRELEGLERYVETAHGEFPSACEVEEGGCRFEVSPAEGQKTGWFFDQARNRDALMPLVGDARVLDVCSYVGAWSVRAAHAGAREVVAVDASSTALERLQMNAAKNGVSDRVNTVAGDAFDVLRDLRHERERFDIVVLDPPAFVKRRKDLKAGSLAYRRLNEAALGLLEPKGGLLLTASCSSHLGAEALLETVQRAARHSDRNVQLLWRGAQGPDHPLHPAIPETGYLKALMLRVLPTQ
jgi:23S rRNA (cytosine1962-C5)-methyltransferase